MDKIVTKICTEYPGVCDWTPMHESHTTYCKYLPAGVCEWVNNVPTAPIPPLTHVLLLSAVYLALVLGGRALMKSHEGRKLPRLLCVHNAILCVFSAACSLGMIFVYFFNTPYHGVNATLCDNKNALFEGFNSWVLFFFLFSKAWEFIDTAFLVIRKSRLRFLHVYHHVITFPLSWFLFIDASPNGTICAFANMLVHTLMYYYYAINALGYTVWWKKYITQMQITQFVLCILTMAYDGLVLRPATSTICTEHKPYRYHSMEVSIAIYFTFLALFIKLYINTYNDKKAKSKPADKPKQEKSE